MEPRVTSPQPQAPGALLPPTVALLQGFVFDEAPRPAPAAAAMDGAVAGETLLREGFRIGGLRLAIRYEDGNELADMPPVYALPRAPAWFRGMANLHGALVPVFDAAGLLQVPRDPDAKPMLLVLAHGDDRAGLMIDGLPVRLRLRAADRIDHATAPAGLADCVDQGYWCDGEDWLDLRVGALLDKLAGELAGAGA